MRKALKIIAWTAACALLLLAAAAVAAKLYFTPERLKTLTLDYARRTLGREVSFDSVNLGLSGLSITNLRVSDYPDFKKGEFLSAGSFAVRPSLRALLRRELKINSVTASGLKLRVKEVKKDTYNFSDLLTPEPAAAAARPAGKPAPAPRLAISSLKVRSSEFSYANAAGDMRVALRGIDLSASGISPDGLFPVEGAFTMDVVSPYFKGSIPASLKGRLALGNFDPAKGRAEIDKAALSLGGVKAELKGSLSNLLEPDAKLTVSVKQFSTSDLKSVFPSLPPRVLLPEVDADAAFKLTSRNVALRSVSFRAGAVSGTLNGRSAWDPKVSYDLSGEVKATLPEGDTTLLARRFKQLPIPAGFKLPMTSLQAKLALKDGRADLSSFSADCGALSLTGRTNVDFGGRALKASGSAAAEIKSLAKLADIAPKLLEPYALSGRAAAKLDYSYAGTLSAKGSAEFSGVGASFAGHSLSGFKGTADITADSISAQKLEGKFDGEDLKASFRARDILKHPKADFEVKMAKLVLKDLPAAQPAAATAKPGKAGQPAPQTYADLSGRVEIGGIEHPNFRCGAVSAKLALTNISEDLRSIDGTASFATGAGKLTELYALAGRYKAAKVALYPLLVLQKSSKLAKTLNLPDFNNVDFDKIEGDYTFTKGLMKLNKSSLTGPQADVTSSGTIDLPAEKLDMRVTTTLKRGGIGGPLAMTVKGTFSDPSVKPDVKSIVEQPAVKKALDKISPDASKLLKGLFKK